ncbi:TonB-dependent receptor [Moraxella cuniculi]|uniref:Iron-regulated outer membrane proteins n=1 Tax=Moraxella cuniculi TaxID=34061 RepID=A0A3S4R094_9GAMM|nr:TonB-dependent receptor [Moraxella cuniculi]VEG12616.1 Iron-regulated outer membrane proteins [Moraxella cuniculi]
MTKSVFTPSLLCVSVLAALSPSVQAAEQPTTVLATEYVTAKRGQQTLKESAQKVLIINREQINDQLLISGDTSQALAKLIPGYAPASEKLGTVGESFRGRDVLFMIDGVPQSNPLRNGSRESRTIDLSMVDRIEVVYGASAEQGLGATGGIINFITKSNREDGLSQQIGVSLSSSSELKSAGLGGDVRYQASYGNDKVDGLFAVKYAKEGMYYQADGRMMGIYGNQGDVQGSDSIDVLTKGSYRLDDNKKIAASVNYYHLEGSQDYVNVAGDRSTGRTDTARKYNPAIDGEQGENPYNDVLTVNATYDDEDFFGTRLSAQVFYNDFAARYGANYAANYQDISIAPNGQLLDQSQNESTKIGSKFTINKDNLWQDKLALTAGVDAMQDTTEQRLIRYNRSWAPKMVYRTVSPFVQARVRLADRLNISAGVRYENGELTVDDFQTLAGYTRAARFGNRRWTTTQVAGGKLKFDELLPSAGVVYDVNNNTQLFANYAKGLGMPDVGNALRGITDVGRSVANTNLEPIVTDNTELGVRFYGEKLSADASVYQSKSDLGSTLQYNPLTEGYQAVRQKTDIKGAEIALRYQATDNTQLSASYAYAQGKYDAAGDGVMVDMPARNISPNKLSLGLVHKLPNNKRFTATATHLFSRDYPAVDSRESSFSGYTLVDVAYRQPLGKGELGIGVNNLLNEEYLNYLTSTVLPTSDRFSGGRGRSYTISYTQSF